MIAGQVLGFNAAAGGDADDEIEHAGLDAADEFHQAILWIGWPAVAMSSARGLA